MQCGEFELVENVISPFYTIDATRILANLPACTANNLPILSERLGRQ